MIVFFLPLLFSWHLFSFNAFTLPKMVFFRVFLLLALFFFLFFVLNCGRKIVWDGKILFLILFLVLSLGLSAFFSVSPDLAFLGRYSRQQGFYSFLSYLLFFLLLIFLFKDSVRIKKSIYLIITSSVLVSLYAWAQYLGLDPLSWSESPRGGRVFSGLGQPNFLGHFLAMVIPLSVYAFLFLVRKLKFKIVLLASLLLQFYVLFLTLSRSAWLALGLGACVGAILFLILTKKKRILFFLLILLMVFSLTVLVFVKTPQEKLSGDNFFSQQFPQRVLNLTNFQQGSGKMRVYYWSAAWREFKSAELKRKILGYGPDTLDKIFAKHYDRDWGVQESINTYPNRAHNLFFDIILHFGLLGFLAFTAFILYILYGCFNYLKGRAEEKGEDFWLVFFLLISLSVYFFNNLFSFSSVTTYVYFYLFLAFLFILSYNLNSKVEKNEIRVKTSPFLRFLLLFFIFLSFSVFIFFYNFNLVRADFYYFQARQEDNCSRVLNNIKRSLSLNSGSRFYKKEYLRHGLNCYHNFKSRKQREQIRENLLYQINSLKKENWDYEFKLFAGRVYSLLSREDPHYYPRAELIYQELIDFNSFMITPYKELAKLKLQQSKPFEALKYIRRGLVVMPSTKNKDLNKEHREEVEKEKKEFRNLLKLAK